MWRDNAPDELSWFQTRPGVSLRLLQAAGVAPPARILDVGGGAGILVDHLLEAGFGGGAVTVLDIAPSALERARKRLGDAASQVAWATADVAAPLPPGLGTFAAWHDRAVLHFLTAPPEQEAYASNLAAHLAPGGVAVLATFAPDGPERCSGLPVQRHDAASLARLLGPGFRLEAEEREVHRTPWGTEQRFQYAVFRRR